MALDMTEWNRIQQAAREGKWGDWHDLRHALCERHAEEHPDDGIGTSDINHMVFGLIEGREDLTPAEALEAARWG